MTDKNKGQETSKTAILTVAEAAELITAQPKSVTVQEGLTCQLHRDRCG